MVNDAKGQRILHTVVPNPRKRYSYYHDFFWAGRYAVFHLHPAFLSPLPMLLGERPFADSLTWAPDQGGVLVVIDARGERPTFSVDVPAVWMWHSANAYVEGNTLAADFIGYDSPDHFLGPNAALRNIMQGREGVARERGTLRRFTVNLDTRAAQLETVADGHFEFPVVHPARVGRRYRHAYAACGNLETGCFHDGLASIDVQSGASSQFNFGATSCVSEPVFVPDVAGEATQDSDAAGWLLCDVLDGASGRSFIAIFDAASVSRGPIAKIHLRHHLPISFHGWWSVA
jgi:all-trans-8'-apo-beta-carotenal 15,15'-oxygenase